MSPGPLWMQQWALVMDAPLPFAACIIAAIGVIWLLVNWGYSRQIDALKQQVTAADQNSKLLKDQIPILERQILEVQRSVQRHDSYAAIGETTASAAATAKALGGLSELLIPVRNWPKRSASRSCAIRTPAGK